LTYVAFNKPVDKCRLSRDDTSLLMRLVNDQTRQSKHIHDDNINAVQSLKHDLLTTMQQHRDSAQQFHDSSLRKIGEQLAVLAKSSTALEKSERILESLYCEEVHSRELGFPMQSTILSTGPLMRGALAIVSTVVADVPEASIDI